MTLVDTSAWVEFFRATGSSAHRSLRALLSDRAPLFTTEVVSMELLAGVRSSREIADVRGALALCELVPLDGLADFEGAAAIYRQCRAAGVTVRQLNDCLIAAVARRADLALLHADRDFTNMASVMPLRLAT